jgi:hypothetical protein
VVSVTVFQPLGQDIRVLAMASVSSKGKWDVAGPRTDLINTGREMFSVRTGAFVGFDEDRQEWLRAFAESFRSAQVVAAITKDTQHKELVAAPELVRQLEEATWLRPRTNYWWPPGRHP